MTVVQKYKPAEMYTCISILHQTPVSNWLNQYKAINKGCSFATRKKKNIIFVKTGEVQPAVFVQNFCLCSFFLLGIYHSVPVALWERQCEANLKSLNIILSTLLLNRSFDFQF